MKTNKLLLLIIVLLVAVNITVIAFVFLHGNKYRPDLSRKHPVDNFMQRKLDLSPQQAEVFDSLRTVHFQYTKTLMRAIHQERKDLLRLMETPTDSIVINTKLKSIGEKNGQLEKANFEHWMQLRKLCTTEQIEKFDTLVMRMIDRQGYSRRHKKMRKAK